MTMPDVFKTVCDKNSWTLEAARADIPIAGGRRQGVVVELFDHEKEKMARIYSNVGPAGDLSETRLRAALGINYRLPHGALAIREDHLVMSDTFLIREADADEVEHSMRSLAETADKYERLIYGTDQH